MRLQTLLMIFALLLPGRPAPCQTKADEEFAKRHFKLGEEYHNRADYEKALEHFTKSFELSKKPALLFNMARCRELLGEHEKAIELYNRYLKHAPPQADLIKERVANLAKLVKKQKDKSEANQKKPAEPKKPEKPKPAPPKPEESAASSRSVAEQREDGGAQSANPSGPYGVKLRAPRRGAAHTQTAQAEPPSNPEPPSRAMRIAGWTLVGVGAAGLITGVVAGALAAEKASELEDLNAAGKTEYASVMEEDDAGRTLQSLQVAAMAGGGVVAAVGAVLLILDYRKASAERTAWLAPAMGRDGAMMTAGVRF